MVTITGKKADIFYKDWVLGDIKNFNVSNDKIRFLGLIFKTDLDQGLMELYNYEKDSNVCVE